MAQYTDAGTVSSTTEILQALTALGLLKRPFSPKELPEEEQRAGGPEMLRLRMAHALAGMAEMQVMHAAIAAGEAGHDGTALIRAAEYLYEGADLENGDGEAQVAVLRLLSQRLADMLMLMTAAIRRGDATGLPLVVMPAMGVASALSTVMGTATRKPEECGGKPLQEAADQLRGMADALDTLARPYRGAERAAKAE
ncbi:hypothetical protein [Streptomyces sp. NPDC000880]